MTRQIRRVGVALLVAFLILFAMLNYLQVFAAQSIASNPANIRNILNEYAVKRGNIVTADGKTVASSKATNDKLKYLRSYPQGELYAHITGYYSLVYGTAGIEAAYNDQLLGEGGVVSVQDVEDSFLGGGEQGDNVELTIDSKLQSLARDALGSNEGAVVALDPHSGDVRAMYGNPTYDPNPLASHDPDQQRRFRATLDPKSPTSPLINKAVQSTYPPGSTFKIVTAAAALDSGRYNARSSFPDPQALDLPLTDNTLTNFTHTACLNGTEIDLFTAVEISCDTTFALLGLKIPQEIATVAEALGFNSFIPFDLPTAASTFPRVPDNEAPLRAYAAIGQGNTAATTLQMALVASAVANGGVEPRPRLVSAISDPSGGIVERFAPESLGRAFSSETARSLTEMMTAVVRSGTATTAQIPGVTVAGKTGTAQTVPGAAPHAWFIAFAPAENPQIAVAVIVENGGSYGSEATGGAVAAPIAKQIIEADKRNEGW